MPNEPMQPTNPTMLARLGSIGALALQRHDQARQQQPKRAAAAYLRAALTCARELARQHKRHPELHAAALDLTERVIAAATTAEAEFFAHGGNSTPYLAVLIAAEGLRLKLMDQPEAALATNMPTSQPAPARANTPATVRRPSAAIRPVTPIRIAAKPAPANPRQKRRRRAS